MPEQSRNQKLDNQLNLAMGLSEEERLQSGELAVGFDPAERTWQVIVKYSGSLDIVRKLGVQAEEMLNEYAILTVPERLLDEVSALPQIEYIEKPKRLFFILNRARSASCISSLQNLPGEIGISNSQVNHLTGKGILVAILDSGIDFMHEAFQNPDGTTRILRLWDQTSGRVFTQEEINEALKTGNRVSARQLVPVSDSGGHGTAVAGIAAGNGVYRGIAYESELLVVKLGTADPVGFPRTTELMRAVNYAVEQAIERKKPLVINISFGNTYGSHDGSSLLETFLNDIGNLGKTTIVVGSGNEGAAAGHTSGTLAVPVTGILTEPTEAKLSVGSFESGFSVQLWKSYEDSLAVSLRTPSGELFGPFPETLETLRYQYGRTQIFIYYGKPSPYSLAQEIYFDFIPDPGAYVESGIWTFGLQPKKTVSGTYDFWLPSAAVLNLETRFLNPTPEKTLTIPSAAEKVITVGAYDSSTRTYADFSGRGFTRLTQQIKPDLVAPGVGIMAPANGGGYQSVTGTSFAAPMTAGAAALMMQWGILKENDPFLYGEKLKAYLRRGARPLPAFTQYPNPSIGFGTLCVQDSLPLI